MIASRLSFTFSLLISASTLAACGGSESDEDQQKEASSAFISEYCEILATCCTVTARPFDQKNCRNFLGYSAAGATFDADAADACLAESRALDCSRADTASQSEDSPCDRVYAKDGKGGAGLGETCEFDQDCAPSTEGKVSCASRFENDEWISSCQVKLAGKQGDGPCVTANASATPAPRVYECDAALYCDTDTEKCTQRPAVGEACDGSDQCEATAYCSSDLICVTSATEGEACGERFCASDLYCDDTSRCVPTKASGSPCESFSECTSGFCTNGICDAESQSSFGIGLMCSLLGGSGN